MSKTIRRYSSDFKHDAVQYVESHPDISMQDAADNLGMPKDTLYGWVKAYRRKLRAGEGEPIKGNLTDDEKEIIRLKPEVLDDVKKHEIFDYIKNNQHMGKEAGTRHKKNVAAYKEALEEMKTQKICPYCKLELVLRQGKNGEFYGCRNFPKCRYTLKK